jgi:hypothetical protein
MDNGGGGRRNASNCGEEKCEKKATEIFRFGYRTEENKAASVNGKINQKENWLQM